jgi:hypothetical protein
MRYAYVEWVDSVHMDAWNPADELEDARPEVSCGILVKETPDLITLALSHAPATDEYGQVVSIPKVAVKKLVVFNQPKVKGPRAPRPAPPRGGTSPASPPP